MILLDGRKVRDGIARVLERKFADFPEKPTLAIIQVGNRPDSAAYINNKKKFADRVGVRVIHLRLTERVSQSELLEEIRKLNDDRTISGIISQFPLPSQIDEQLIADAILAHKDVDAIGSAATLARKSGALRAPIPATARGVRELLKFYGIFLRGKKVCIIGRSKYVGTPIAEMCRAEGGEVVVCHSQTVDLVKEIRATDVIISAVGKPRLITSKHVRPGQIVVDVGINSVNGKLVGDVDFNKVKDIVAAISPVPGGVGPMTVAAVFENLYDLCSQSS